MRAGAGRQAGRQAGKRISTRETSNVAAAAPLTPGAEFREFRLVFSGYSATIQRLFGDYSATIRRLFSDYSTTAYF